MLEAKTSDKILNIDKTGNDAKIKSVISENISVCILKLVLKIDF